MTRALAACLFLLAAAASPALSEQRESNGLAAQAPVVNAVVERRAPSADFARDVRTAAERQTPAWVGYKVPIQRRSDVSMQGYESCCGRCRIAPPTDLVVLARVQGGAILELRPLAVDCDMDAGGMPLFWFDGVTADASVAWLSTLVNQPAERGERRPRVAENALSALSGCQSQAASRPRWNQRIVSGISEGTGGTSSRVGPTSFTSHGVSTLSPSSAWVASVAAATAAGPPPFTARAKS